MLFRSVSVIVSLRTTGAMSKDEAPFDEEAYARSKGIEYVWLPTTPDSLDDETIEKFADALHETKGKALVHCNSANTSGGLWAAYLNKKRGFSLEEAIERGRAAGLSRDSMTEAVRRVAKSDG